MAGRTPDWCIVIAYYNERSWLPATLRCALAQRGADRIVVLVDNGSTDGTGAAIAPMIAGRDDVLAVAEPQPGQTHALHAGFAAARAIGAAKIAFWDADTLYPDHYLARADRLLGDDPGAVGAMAIDLYAPFAAPSSLWQRWRVAAAARLLPHQGHTGTFGQAFRVEALARAGGPRSAHWPWVLHDHELVNRVRRQGRMRYHPAHVCWPSPRRADGAGVRWTLAERLRYHATPAAGQDVFFHDWLGPRLAARRLGELKLRDRDWERLPASVPDRPVPG